MSDVGQSVSVSGRLRVLLLTSEFPPARGGIQLLMQRLAASTALSHVLVVTIGVPQESDTTENYRVKRTAPGSRLSAVARLNALAVVAGARFRPDVILSGHILCGPAAYTLGRVLGVSYVQYVHAKELGYRPRLARAALARADAVIGVSTYTRQLVMNLQPATRQVYVVPNGVDAPTPRQHERAEVPTIVTVARLDDAHKGHDVLLKAFSSVREQIPDARMVFVGDGDLRPSLERQAVSLGVRPYVEFTGSVSDRERDAWLDRAHVFVMLSRVQPGIPSGDGFGIVYLEAGAHALPVIAGAEGGALDSVVDGQTGLLVDPRDHHSVARALIDVLSDEALASTLGEGGLEHARQLSWERVAAEVRDVLQAVKPYRTTNAATTTRGTRMSTIQRGAKRLAGGAYRRVNRTSTVGLSWKRHGDHITFRWDGFVAAPSIPMLFARHHFEVATIRRLLSDKNVQRSLEFGCGFGRLTPTLADLSARHTAADINGEALAAASAAYPDLEFLHLTGNRLPFDDDTFDLIVTWTVLQHVPPHLVEATMADMVRVLTPDGRLLLCEETRLAGAPSQHAWHREPEFYERHFAPRVLTFSSYIEEIDRIPGLVSPGRVMLFEPAG